MLDIISVDIYYYTENNKDYNDIILVEPMNRTI